jgi:hypothetical protein
MMYAATCRHGVQVAGTCGIEEDGPLAQRSASAIAFALQIVPKVCAGRGRRYLRGLR